MMFKESVVEHIPVTGLFVFTMGSFTFVLPDLCHHDYLLHRKWKELPLSRAASPTTSQIEVTKFSP